MHTCYSSYTPSICIPLPPNLLPPSPLPLAPPPFSPHQDTLLGQLKWGSVKENSSQLVVDADWATSDKPVLLTNDGCIRVYDTKLQSCHSAIVLQEFGGPYASQT